MQMENVATDLLKILLHTGLRYDQDIYNMGK